MHYGMRPKLPKDQSMKYNYKLVFYSNCEFRVQFLDREVFTSTRMILIINLFILPTSLVLIPTFYWLGFKPGAMIVGFASLCSLFFPYIVKSIEDSRIIGNFFAICSVLTFTALSIFSGGTDSPFLVWFLTIPPIGFLYLKKEHAIAWCAVVALSVLLIAVAQEVDILPVSTLPKEANAIISLFSLTLITYLFVIVVMNFRKTFLKMNRRLSSTNEKLLNSNLELERFAAIASHDLKNPVRNISSFIQLLKNMHGDNIPEQGHEFIDIIDRNAKQAWQLIDDILAYSQASQPEVRLESVDLNSTLSMIQRQLLENETYVKASVKIDCLPVIMGDATRLTQVFTNIIENGLKYNRSEKPEIIVRYHKRKGSHHFEISDNGIGIDSKHIGQVFEMFKRLHGQQEFKGTGIGLAICHKAIQLMGGSIDVISMVGRGSTFRVELPIQEGDHMPKYSGEVALSTETKLAN